MERAHIETREMDFLYAEPTGLVLMDTQTYDQITIPSDLVGEASSWLAEGMRVLVETHEGNPIGIELPKALEAVVRETEPVVKGQTAARSNKPATLENGVVVQVPPFIEAGDRIRVDPTEGRYIERAK